MLGAFQFNESQYVPEAAEVRRQIQALDAALELMVDKESARPSQADRGDRAI